MTDKNSIRLLWRQGDSVAEIARKTGVSRDTVYKYRDMDDFSPEPPARRAQGSKLDPYRPLIESWLDDDMRSGRKQRHTAKRVHDRLSTSTSSGAPARRRPTSARPTST